MVVCGVWLPLSLFFLLAPALPSSPNFALLFSWVHGGWRDGAAAEGGRRGDFFFNLFIEKYTMKKYLKYLQRSNRGFWDQPRHLMRTLQWSIGDLKGASWWSHLSLSRCDLGRTRAIFRLRPPQKSPSEKLSVAFHDILEPCV